MQNDYVNAMMKVHVNLLILGNLCVCASMLMCLHLYVVVLLRFAYQSFYFFFFINLTVYIVHCNLSRRQEPSSLGEMPYAMHQRIQLIGKELIFLHLFTVLTLRLSKML